MRKLIVLLLIIIYSCSSKIDKREIQGTWYWNYKENDENNIGEIIIKNDSIYLIDYLNYLKKGNYKIVNDSIIINLKNEALRKKITVTDTSLILNSTYFRKSYEEDFNNEIKREYELIDLKSDIQLTAEHLSNHQGDFLLNKENDSIKIRFWNKNSNLKEYINFNQIHFENIGHVALLGKNITLKELKELYLEMNYFNIRGLKYVTKIDFKKHKYYVYFVGIDVWDKEVNEYSTQNNLEKYNRPNIPENYSKEKYIQLNNPFLLKIESKSDFIELRNIISNSTCLISINNNLSVEDYLLLHQKINKLRKNKNLKIRTEII